MSVLVTGGAGFIGSHVIDAFVSAGHQVAIVDNLSTGSRVRMNPEARLHVMDLRSARLQDVFAAERPEAVAHLAAQAVVARSVADPAFDASVNILGGLNLLQCCRRAGVRRIIYSSSGGAAYGDTDILPTPEDHPTLPLSPYGITKTTQEGDQNMIDEQLRAILACPACKGDLIFEEDRIICPACKKAYPVRDGIPVMLISEAEPWTGSK